MGLHAWESCLPFHGFEPVPITIPVPVSTESSNLSKSPPESIMPLTIMENTKTDLETGGDLPRLNHQPELHVYSWKAKHQAPQEVPAVTLHEHCQLTEPETNPKCEGVSGFPSSQQEDILQQQNDLDMSIAVKKSIRSCTKHPISNCPTATYLHHTGL